jgi:hypothetical protein
LKPKGFRGGAVELAAVCNVETDIRPLEQYLQEREPSGGLTPAELVAKLTIYRHGKREPMAGFSDDDGRTEGVYEGKLWCARLLADDMVIPVRMDFATEFGPVSAHLAELCAQGTELRFAD